MCMPDVDIRHRMIDHKKLQKNVSGWLLNGDESCKKWVLKSLHHIFFYMINSDNRAIIGVSTHITYTHVPECLCMLQH